MYITYDTEQWEIVEAGGYIGSGNDKKHKKVIEAWKNKNTLIHQHDSTLEEKQDQQQFKPTWLVRASDMQLVSGSSITDNTQYHALSYSWNQSGEIIKRHSNSRNKYDRVDDGKHTIISGWHKLRKRKHVHFEAIIQRICKDFDIKYIWYDQMCIDQTDTIKKQHEIQQMHHIYQNAHYTVVLLPELEYLGEKNAASHRGLVMDTILETEWVKRVWTLEEAYMSRKMLFVGKNVHMWSIVGQDCIPLMTRTGHFLYNICMEQGKWNASTALWFARTRSSTEQHDWIFALTNMFPAIKPGITFRYDMTISALTIQFYRLLMEHDPTILLFGEPYTSNDLKVLNRRRQQHHHQQGASDIKDNSIMSPSWTGIFGTHIPQNKIDSLLRSETPNSSKGSLASSSSANKINNNYIIDGNGYLHITSTAIPVYLRGPSWMVPINSNNDDLFSSSRDRLVGGLPFYPIWENDSSHQQLLYINSNSNNINQQSSFLPDNTISSYVTFIATTLGQAQKIWNCFSQTYRLKSTHILPVKIDKENSCWVNTLLEPTNVAAYLSLTDGNSRGECIILNEIQFRMDSCIALPVIKKIEKSSDVNNPTGRTCYYQSIGLCFITDLYSLDSKVTLEKQEFVIK
ncbi:hypothetical protein INT45_004174 [Circinella minor]|uniref:Heterokaryon incompatibility domain-containing protein n=1 Tax=Circinella minor TaxID=1195481 RepID=A0A8H7RTP5_9FUNG|nr:hypothetical protein INT45_004174 [Circinella minor]